MNITEQSVGDNMLLSDSELVDVSRSRMYKLLALAFGFPGKELQESQQELWDSAEAFCPGLGLNRDPAELTGPHFESLYINVFDGHAPDKACRPYESAWSDGDKVKHQWEVKAFYRFFGLDINEESKELPDHIVNELEFMHFLATRGVEADRVESKDPNGREHYLRAQKDFLERHLHWMPAFCEALEKKTDELFYVQLARITARFVKDDLEWVREQSGNPGPSTQEGPIADA
jgi:DMSO reductase family type II enzyme chaperone